MHEGNARLEVCPGGMVSPGLSIRGELVEMYVAMTDRFPGEWRRGSTESQALSGLSIRWGVVVLRIHDAWIDPRVDGLCRVWADRGPLLEGLDEKALPPIIAEAWRLARRGGKREYLDPVTWEPVSQESVELDLVSEGSK